MQFGDHCQIRSTEKVGDFIQTLLFEFRQTIIDAWVTVILCRKYHLIVSSMNEKPETNYMKLNIILNKIIFTRMEITLVSYNMSVY